MSLVVFQHEKHETAGRLGDILRDYGHKLRVVELYAGQPVPADLDNVDGVISMGGTPNVEDADKFAWMPKEMAYLKAAHEAGKPVVGICLGAQLIAATLGGKVAAMAAPEVGWAGVKLGFPGTVETLYQGLPWDSVQFHLHGQEVTTLPPGGTPLAGSKGCKIQSFKVGLRTYGFQYHFESTREDIKAMAADGLVTKAGVASASILQQTDAHYDTYRRLGDRLCETIAMTLFPIDKRH
ncbi:MAG: type 1 glutamine amidotransferase [Planctomycetes bacterium]|nr:type 1 glutamine amidotransferase [Planctomycetota bacterium]